MKNGIFKLDNEAIEENEIYCMPYMWWIYTIPTCTGLENILNEKSLHIKFYVC